MRGRFAIAGFKTHIAVSSCFGGAYGAFGALALGQPLPVCGLAGGLCGLSGMLPDLDSDTSIPVREVIAFSAAVLPMLMVERFEVLGLSYESMALAGAAVYLFVRFGFGKILKKTTVHRGMFHSLPAAIIAGLLAFLVCHSPNGGARLFLALAVFSGYLSHLLLDEFYSIHRTQRGWQVKKSFGTAVKLHGNHVASNAATYGSLLLLGILAVKDATVLVPPSSGSHSSPPLRIGTPGEGGSEGSGVERTPLIQLPRPRQDQAGGKLWHLMTSQWQYLSWVQPSRVRGAAWPFRWRQSRPSFWEG